MWQVTVLRRWLLNVNVRSRRGFGGWFRCRSCLQPQILMEKLWFLPNSHPRKGFAALFPRLWVHWCWLQPGCAPVHYRSIAVCADCLRCHKLDYEGVCQCFGFSKCLPILETSAVSQLLQAWPATLLGKLKSISLWIIQFNIPAHKSRWLFI